MNHNKLQIQKILFCTKKSNRITRVHVRGNLILMQMLDILFVNAGTGLDWELNFH
jgi:hypothetical protein